MRTILAFSIVALFLSGCSFLQPTNEEITLERKAELITTAAREGTKIALREIYDNDQERAEAAVTTITSLRLYVLPVLTNPEAEITETVAQELLNSVPEKWQGIMAAAYETLHTYYEFPTTAEILPPDYLTLLTAFFQGIDRGAQDVLDTLNVEVRLGINVNVTEPVQ